MKNIDKHIIYNSIVDQKLSYSNQLNIHSWNNIINTLKVQANTNAYYLESLHNILFGEDNYQSDKTFIEYITSIDTKIDNTKTELEDTIASVKSELEDNINTTKAVLELTIAQNANTLDTKINDTKEELEDTITTAQTNLKNEFNTAIDRVDEALEKHIEEVDLRSDSVDVVGTYTDLESYDTSKLTENDIVKVLKDETLQGATSMYRWVNNSWHYINSVGPYYTETESNELLNKKVNKVEGKELSTNDFTNEFKEKLEGVEEGANNYVLPQDVVHDINYVHTDNNFTNEEKTKLENLENYDDSELKENLKRQTSRSYLVETIGNATQSLEGLMTAEDKVNLNTLVNLLKDDDEDNVVNTIAEILKVFKNYAEGTDIVSILAGKLDKNLNEAPGNDVVYMCPGSSKQFELRKAVEYVEPWTIARRDGYGGITMNHVVLQGNPENPNDATKKQYVDNADNYIKANVTMKDRTFKNPVIENTATEDYFPDPTVWSGDDGYFYSLATSYGKHLFRSVDLVNWEDCGYSPIDNETVTKLQTELGYNKIWAPSVHKVGTKWLMYIAGVHDRYASGYNNDDHTGIIVLTANKCNGYFTFANVILTSTSTEIKDCIDPFLDYDPLTNKLQLYFGSTGGIHRVDMSANGLSIKSGAVPEHIAGKTISESPSRGNVFEGAYVYYRGKYKYLFVSFGKAQTCYYQLGVGRATLQEDGTWSDFVNKEGDSLLEGVSSTILTATYSTFNGPGHNGNVFTDKLGKTYMFYHCHKDYLGSSGTSWKRAMFLQELKWDEESWCYFENNTPVTKEVYPYFPSPQPNMIGYPNDIESDEIIINDIKMYKRGTDKNITKNYYDNKYLCSMILESHAKGPSDIWLQITTNPISKTTRDLINKNKVVLRLNYPQFRPNRKYGFVTQAGFLDSAGDILKDNVYKYVKDFLITITPSDIVKNQEGKYIIEKHLNYSKLKIDHLLIDSTTTTDSKVGFVTARQDYSEVPFLTWATYNFNEGPGPFEHDYTIRNFSITLMDLCKGYEFSSVFKFARYFSMDSWISSQQCGQLPRWIKVFLTQGHLKQKLPHFNNEKLYDSVITSNMNNLATPHTYTNVASKSIQQNPTAITCYIVPVDSMDGDEGPGNLTTYSVCTVFSRFTHHTNKGKFFKDTATSAGYTYDGVPFVEENVGPLNVTMGVYNKNGSEHVAVSYTTKKVKDEILTQKCKLNFAVLSDNPKGLFKKVYPLSDTLIKDRYSFETRGFASKNFNIEVYVEVELIK